MYICVYVCVCVSVCCVCVVCCVCMRERGENNIDTDYTIILYRDVFVHYQMYAEIKKERESHIHISMRTYKN